MELRKDNEYIEIDVNFSFDDIDKNDSDDISLEDSIEVDISSIKDDV